MAPFDGGRGPHLPPGKRWRGYASEKSGMKPSNAQARATNHPSSSQTRKTVAWRTNWKQQKVAVRKSCRNEKRECPGQEHDCECEPKWKKQLRLETPWANDVPKTYRNEEWKVGYEDLPAVESDERCTPTWQGQQIDPQVLASASDTNHVRDVSWSDLRIFKRIGIGAYADVLGGKFRGRKVAIKRFKNADINLKNQTGGEESPENATTALDVWSKMQEEASRLVRYRHPNVSRIVGICQWPPALVLELAGRGSLWDFLRRHRKLSSQMQWKFASDIANAMSHLHNMQPPLVHRDLTSSNVLITDQLQAKVADLGIATVGVADVREEAGSFGAVPWMAPEVLRETGVLSEKCDVYSFGVIVWELATGLVPWGDMNPYRVMVAVAREGARLPIPADCPDWMKKIMRSCWQEEPAYRPDFERLSALLAGVCCT